MPADSATTVLGLLLMGTGNDDNTWGDLLNAQVIQYVEDKLCGSTTVTTTGGATTLTQTQCRARFLDIVGVLTSDATLTVPEAHNSWIVNNATSGGFAVIFKTPAGASICTAPQTPYTEIRSFPTAGCIRADKANVGEYFYHAGTAVPGGAAECTGAAISRTGIGRDLFGVIGTTHGVGNGTTTFNLPDAYTAGKFLRSRTAAVAAGTAQSGAIESHGHAGSTAATTLSGSVDSGGGHTPTFASGTATTSLSGSVDAGGGHTPTLSSSSYSTSVSGTVAAGGSHTHDGTTLGVTAQHTHSGTTGNQSANHNHAGTTGNNSVDHTHSTPVPAGATTFPGNSGGAVAAASPTSTAYTSGGASALHTHDITTGVNSADHTHAFTSSVESQDHAHGFTTNAGGSHDHSFSGSATTTCTALTMNAVANHQHAVTGVSAATSVTGITLNAVAGHQHAVTGVTAATPVTIAANGGAETRPTNISGILCVRL